ncbi:MAG: acyl-CoA/acyl-ACP dehydrogenase [Reyranella sp.]|uniref:acyl-CoA dehydrogenase family protein n=2 Tax=Bacteria TaxID=2 RepID=UPI001ACD9594|nr:acyl-CoA dehydrogenase family protein [Reyranella sp.]MBN9090667.1 acyl-CoA/acyl-ACP dehydrogenase [Reyranella sp.]
MSQWLAAARAVGGVAERHADDVDRDARFPGEAIAALKQEKLLGLLVPESAGGPGGTIADAVAICHALGQHCAATAMIYAMHQIQVACIVRHGGTDWHRAFLRRLAGDQLLLASATSEAGVGGDVRSSICSIEQTNDRFALAKEATVISYGADSDGILVTARKTPHSPASDQVIVVVPKAGCVLEQDSGWDTLGMRGTCSNGYHLKATGEMAQLLPVSYAEVSAQTMLPVSHLVWSALWSGIATNAVARARAYVRAEARKKNGTPPARLAEAASLLQLMRSNVVAALRQFEAASASPDELLSMPFAVAMNNLKVGSSQMAVQVINHALLICGLAGYRNDSPYSLGRHLRDAHSAALMVNNDRILANTGTLLMALREDPDLL